MKLDTGIATRDLALVPAEAKAAEENGFDAIWSMEAGNDGFLPLALAAEHTSRIKMGPSVAIAFPRSPMTTAYASWDLAALSKGRFILGLGTQVKGHIERRYGVKWEPPVPKLREYILSLRAIFKCWADGGKKLSFQGKYFNFSLMTPFFAPRPHNYPIPIYIAGVNEYMCRLAGELCDGFHVHPFHSIKYLREVVLPNLHAGAAKAGREASACKLSSSAFVIAGKDAKEIAAAKGPVKTQIAFYASTPAYRGVLEAHAWGDTQAQLNEMTRKGDWTGMANLITDEMLEAYAVQGSWEEIPGKIKSKYAGILDRVAFYFPFREGADQGRWREIVKSFNG